MSDVATIIQAREEARRARVRLSDDISLLQHRTSPSVLAAEAAQSARNAAAEAADNAVELMKAKPGLALGGFAALGLALCAKPLRRAAGTAGSFAWRNRSTLGRLFIRSSTGHARRDED